MTSWKWGDAHQARHLHPLLGRLPILGDWVNIALPSDGGDDTINRGQTARAADDPVSFPHVHGAGYRVVYDLADLAGSRFMIATGQSGHPLSDHYRDLAVRWRDGESRRLSGSRAALAQGGAKILTLAPP